MRTGKKRTLVRIEQSTPTKSDSGAVSDVWTLYTNMWVSITTMRGFEKQSATAAWPGSDTRIEMDFIGGVLPTMRVVLGDIIYSILAVDNIDQRSRELKLTCESGVKSA